MAVNNIPHADTTDNNNSILFSRGNSKNERYKLKAANNVLGIMEFILITLKRQNAKLYTFIVNNEYVLFVICLLGFFI